MPSLFSRLSVAARMSALVGASLLILASVVASISLYMKLDAVRGLTQTKLEIAVEVFSSQLAQKSAGLGNTGRGGVSGEVDLAGTGQQVTIPAGLIEEVSELTGSALTYFERDLATGQFRRNLTTLRDTRGERQTGTFLDPSSPEFAALSSGVAYRGEVIVGEDRFLAAYEPILDPTGRIVGAIGAAVHADNIFGEALSFLGDLVPPTLLVLVLALTGTYFAIRRELGPLVRIVASLGRMANRDYQTAIPETASQNEMGELTKACVALRADLLEAARLADVAAAQEAEREVLRKELSRVVDDLRAGLSRLADGDLTMPIPSTPENPFPAEYDPLRQSYNQVIERISQVIEQVTMIARGVRDSSAEIAEASRELSGRAETQAATLEESAAALTELTQSVASTAERAGMAQEASFGNRTGAERGAEIVRDAVTAMQGIERGSEQITRIIGVIDDIAFQTNLLALNAGVEAARAGDAGRGFAVVASEVRLLAQRASESAREIKGLISDSTQQVDHGSALVRKTGDSLAEILGRANEAASLVADIALAAAEQARGLAEVNSGVNQLDHVTQQNSAVAEETSAAAATLQSRSEELLTALSGFRINGAGQGNIFTSTRSRNESREPAIEAKVVDWAPVVAAAANGPRANRAKANGTWAEF